MQFLDIPTLITIAIAIGILLYLRSILGQRTGHQKPEDFFDRASERDVRTGEDAENVVKLPNRGGENADASNPHLEEINQIAKPRTKLNKGLRAVHSADPSFSPGEFLNGANMAYEMIVTAFADADKRSLKNLLSRDVYESFASVIDDRSSRGEVVKSSFVGIDDSQIAAAELDDGIANVTVRFESQIVSSTHDKDGKLIEGDDNEVVRVKDVWTFSRNTRSRDPNWKLVATEAED